MNLHLTRVNFTGRTAGVHRQQAIYRQAFDDYDDSELIDIADLDISLRSIFLALMNFTRISIETL